MSTANTPPQSDTVVAVKEREIECYTLTMVNEITERRVTADRKERGKVLIRAFMNELGKHHKDSEPFKALTRFWVATGGSINVCGEL